MTAFERAVARELRGVEAFSVGPCPGCAECGLDGLVPARVRGGHGHDTAEAYALAGEPSFSWDACEGCGSTLGGDRFPAHGFVGGGLCHFQVCVDCYLYHANGEHPAGPPWGEPEPAECPQCGGPPVELGTLGPTTHHRCRCCGWVFT